MYLVIGDIRRYERCTWLLEMYLNVRKILIYKKCTWI